MTLYYLFAPHRSIVLRTWRGKFQIFKYSWFYVRLLAGRWQIRVGIFSARLTIDCSKVRDALFQTNRTEHAQCSVTYAFWYVRPDIPHAAVIKTNESSIIPRSRGRTPHAILQRFPSTEQSSSRTARRIQSSLEPRFRSSALRAARRYTMIIKERHRANDATRMHLELTWSPPCSAAGNCDRRSAPIHVSADRPRGRSRR